MMFNIDLTGRKTCVTVVRLDRHGAVVISFVASGLVANAPVAELVLAVPADAVVEIFRQLNGKLPGVVVS